MRLSAAINLNALLGLDESRGFFFEGDICIPTEKKGGDGEEEVGEGEEEKEESEIDEIIVPEGAELLIGSEDGLHHGVTGGPSCPSIEYGVFYRTKYCRKNLTPPLCVNGPATAAKILVDVSRHIRFEVVRGTQLKFGIDIIMRFLDADRAAGLQAGGISGGSGDFDFEGDGAKMFPFIHFLSNLGCCQGFWPMLTIAEVGSMRSSSRFCCQAVYDELTRRMAASDERKKVLDEGVGLGHGDLLYSVDEWGSCPTLEQMGFVRAKEELLSRSKSLVEYAQEAGAMAFKSFELASNAEPRWNKLCSRWSGNCGGMYTGPSQVKPTAVCHVVATWQGPYG